MPLPHLILGPQKYFAGPQTDLLLTLTVAKCVPEGLENNVAFKELD